MEIKRLLTSCFGLGFLPIAPGTFGSMPVAIVFGLMVRCGAPAFAILVVMAIFAVAGSVVCVVFSPAIIAATGKTDPAEVVADEFAGQAVTFFVLSVFLASTAPLWMVFAAFVLFRIFDVIKPWPIKKLEKLPSGWGILADDLLAGIYAAALLFVALMLWNLLIAG